VRAIECVSICVCMYTSMYVCAQRMHLCVHVYKHVCVCAEDAFVCACVQACMCVLSILGLVAEGGGKYTYIHTHMSHTCMQV
jgi:hypothetical protein